MRLGDAREVGSSWEVLADQAVGVFVAAALPGTSRVAEVDLHLGGDRKALVCMHLLALIPRQRTSQLSGSLRTCLASAATTVVVSLRGSLTSIVKRLWRSISVAMCVSFPPVRR